MESAGLRNREKGVAWKADGFHDNLNGADGGAVGTPRYIIDLSLPPVERYQRVAEDFKPELTSLPRLFDEVVQGLHPKLSVYTVQRVARLLLRRLNSKEQTQELRGIQKVTGIAMYLLVAFNVLLDLFMGCTSGGARVRRSGEGIRMLHFRTLDWGMDALRKTVVQLDFVQRPAGPVVATSVTYVGFVGVLTGVRKGLSISLNFRPNHDSSSRIANFRFYFHHVLVLLGFRPSISSLLRLPLLPRNPKSKFSTLASIERHLPATVTTAAYLIFSDGKRIITMEKDHRTALVKSAEDFLVITNHDEAEELQPHARNDIQSTSHTALEMTGMLDLVEESKSRKGHVVGAWEKSSKGSGSHRAISQRTLIQWLNSYPITNEETHFALVMDPGKGEVVWIKRYLDPA